MVSTGARKCVGAFGAVTVGLAVVLGCTDVPMFGSSAGPAVYITLSRDLSLQQTTSPSDSSLYGVVVTIGSLSGSPYRTIDAFSMTRRADGARFDWTVVSRTGSVAQNGRVVQSSESGNLRLPWSGTGGRLGRDSLVAGDIVDFTLETEGVLVTGSAIMPAATTISVAQQNGMTTMYWNRAAGAASYHVTVDTDQLSGFITPDTMYVLRRDRYIGATPSPAYFTVVAVDANIAAILGDTTLRRAGVVGAVGFIGATARSRIVIPPP